MLNKQLPSVRDKRHKREAINKSICIFQDVGNFMEIKVRRENGRRLNTSFCKAKIMIIILASGELSILPFFNLRRFSSTLAYSLLLVWSV